MAGRLLPILLSLLLIVALAPGCSEKNAPLPAATPTPAAPITTPLPSTPPVTSVAPSPSPQPFPQALSLGDLYRYGREDVAMQATVYRVKAMDGYEWWSPQWGRYWNTTPKTGNHFIFALVRLVDGGTARARLPSPAMFVLRGDGGSYIETSDRDSSLPIKGIEVKQYDYFYDRTAGWIDPGESNRVDGFLLFEVPENLAPENTYLGVTFQSNADAVWKLG